MIDLEGLKSIKTRRDIIAFLRSGFKKREYPETLKGASDFQRDLEREGRGINRQVTQQVGREIQDIIMDEFNIPG